MADVNLGLFTNACRSKQGMPSRLTRLQHHQTWDIWNISNNYLVNVWQIHSGKRMIRLIQNKGNIFDNSM